MSTKNFRTSFTNAEYKALRSLVIQKEKADSDEQKGIRAKMRKIGFHWREVGSGKFNLENFEALFQNGTLSIIGGNASLPDTKNGTSASSSVAGDNPAILKAPDFTTISSLPKSGGRANSDESYVIDLCDEVLGRTALRQHRFPFLTGDSGVRLPVDAYYPDLNLVVEYHERQHTESVALFDRRITVSGVSRGEQRRIYDERRAEVLPRHGIRLVIISYTDFGISKRLRRNRLFDIQVVKALLSTK